MATSATPPPSLPDRRWQEFCAHIRFTDDVSFKLLALVPSLSVAGIAVALMKSDPKFGPLTVLLSLFAAATTLALWIWERRNIQQCRWLRERAAALEEDTFGADVPGHFHAYPAGPGGLGKWEAERLVYGLSIAVWLALPLVIFFFDSAANSDPAGWLGAAGYAVAAVGVGYCALEALRRRIDTKPAPPSLGGPMARSLLRAPLTLMPFLAVLFGVLLILLSEPEPSQWWRHLVRDVGIGGIVSACVFYFIELRAHLERDRAARESVHQEIYGEMAGPDIWADVTASIIQSGISCDFWQLSCALSLEPVTRQDAAGRTVTVDACVSRGLLEYALVNHHKADKNISLRHELEYSATGTTSGGRSIPRFTRLKYSLKTEDGRVTDETFDEERLRQVGHWKGAELLECPLTLEPRATVRVEVEREEVLNVPGEFPWYVFWVTREPRVSIAGPAADSLDYHVLLRHHSGPRAIPRKDGKWALPRILLPGQGFAILIREKEAAKASPKDANPAGEKRQAV